MREEENNRSSQSSSFKRFMKKRWVFPAIYIACAAMVLTGVLWYQASGSNKDKYSYNSSNLAGKNNQPAVEVSRTMENFVMPIPAANKSSAVIEKKFYDFSGKKADQEAALVVYKNTYVPNTGIDIGMKDGKSFNVVASLSGTVTKVDNDSFLGNLIEIEHDKGIVTQYESVTDIKVKVGDHVDQGQVIAKAGQSLFNEKAGTHVHFEIRKDGVAVNPESYMNKPVSVLEEQASGQTTDTNSSVNNSQSSNTQDNSNSSTSSDNTSTDSTNS